MRITESQLRRIVQEEATKMIKESRGAHPRGGSDEGRDDDEGDGWGSGPSARELGFKAGDRVVSIVRWKMGTVNKASEWDTLLNIEWDDGTRGDLDARYARKA